MSEEKSRGHDRTRNWCAVVYPESAPENWQELLDDYHIEWIESPLHEFDTNPTGEIKKAHYHIILCFSGPKSYEQVCEVLAPLHCTIPQRVESLKGCVRYMAHLDNPEKFQYSLSDIKTHGGIDLSDALRPPARERYQAIDDMLQYCEDNGIDEFIDLMNYARVNRREDWFPLLCDNSALIVSLTLKSKHFKVAAATDGLRPSQQSK